MILHAFAVYDTKAESFNAPYFTQTIGLALRGFEDMALDPNSVIAKHPEDYSLFQLGSYDMATGVFTQDKPPEAIAYAHMVSPPTGMEIGDTTIPQINGNATEEANDNA